MLKKIKKGLYSKFPKPYFFCRDVYHFSKLALSGEFKKIYSSSLDVQTFEQAFSFTNRFIKSHQIHSEIKGLIELIDEHKPNSYIEIGMADGGTHFLIRKLCKSIKLSIAVDTDIRNKYLLNRITPIEKSHYVCGFSNNLKTINRVKRLVGEEQKVDVLFIDGDHSYDGVKQDFDNYNGLVRKGGLIVFHDIIEDWGTRYGKKTNKYTGGVPTFFAEVKNDYQSHLFIDNAEQDGFGIGVIVQN